MNIVWTKPALGSLKQTLRFSQIEKETLFLPESLEKRYLIKQNC